MVKPMLISLAERLFGFELLVGPYAVAHYRLHKELDGIGVPPASRLNVFLADTLSEPGAATPLGKLGMISAKIIQEREGADELKTEQPILAIIGNPPYRRLAAGETAELVGRWMADMWEDLKRPVQDAGWGVELNTFPDLYIAFWRWALWKLFERPGADGRGVVSLITNRTFLAGHPYAGLRKMLGERFDHIEVIDLRGNLRLGARAGVVGDEGVFDIQTGTAVTIAWSCGKQKSPAHSARVEYVDAWRARRFNRTEKLAWLAEAATAGAVGPGIKVERGLLENLRPRPVPGSRLAFPDRMFFIPRLQYQDTA
jgi:predicted helicase